MQVLFLLPGNTLEYLLHYLFFGFAILNQCLSIADLPPETKLTDLSKLVDLDMKKLPHPEESGDRCICHIQEFLINEMSSAECGVLPEDKLQRLVVGVSTLCFFQQLFTNSSLVVCSFYSSTNSSLHFITFHIRLKGTQPVRNCNSY